MIFWAHSAACLSTGKQPVCPSTTGAAWGFQRHFLPTVWRIQLKRPTICFLHLLLDSQNQNLLPSPCSSTATWNSAPCQVHPAPIVCNAWTGLVTLKRSAIFANSITEISSSSTGCSTGCWASYLLLVFAMELAEIAMFKNCSTTFLCWQRSLAPWSISSGWWQPCAPSASWQSSSNFHCPGKGQRASLFPFPHNTTLLLAWYLKAELFC